MISESTVDMAKVHKIIEANEALAAGQEAADESAMTQAEQRDALRAQRAADERATKNFQYATARAADAVSNGLAAQCPERQALVVVTGSARTLVERLSAAEKIADMTLVAAKDALIATTRELAATADDREQRRLRSKREESRADVDIATLRLADVRAAVSAERHRMTTPQYTADEARLSELPDEAAALAVYEKSAKSARARIVRVAKEVQAEFFAAHATYAATLRERAEIARRLQHNIVLPVPVAPEFVADIVAGIGVES